MTEYIKREIYFRKIKPFKDKPVVKVISGMRRVGKSVLLKLLIEQLLEDGVSKENIVYINKESLEYDEINDYKSLYSYVKKNLQDKDSKKYVFIDEVQEIDEWERAVNSFLSEGLADIYISGSNAKILSSELATLLSGRFIEIRVYPLTFKEFINFSKTKKNDIESLFQQYLKYGGLPGIHFLTFDDEVLYNYLNAILDTILYKDVVSRFRIREISVFDKIVRYLFDNIGNIVSSKKIADFFKSQRVKVSVDSVVNYLRYLESAFLLHKVGRFDLKGKKLLEFNEKIYTNDIGLRNCLIGFKPDDINYLLENIVYNELKVRGYEVSVGILNKSEIDFVASKNNNTIYIQVCYLLSDNSVIEREFGNLEKIHDNYEKLVISLDRFFPENRKGIKHKNLLDFLLESTIKNDPTQF